MADMIAAGVHFYDAREPLTVSQTEETLDQLARLHAHPELLEGQSWIPCRLDEILVKPYPTWEKTQELMHDERRGDLPDRTLDAGMLKKAMARLAELNRDLPQTILHGDVHPGNIYRTAKNEMAFTDWQLIQHGHWSLDVAYHINSVLPIEVAEKEERQLLDSYLDAVQRHGGTVPDSKLAWDQYRRAPAYGFYHWAITQRVRPVEITHQAFRRLGAAVTRHESYQRLGL
jgi:Ser/Thr protein kinase RdoA (MazF antagonist)